MPGQVRTYKIDNTPKTPFRENKNLELEIIFGSENNPSITLDGVRFVNSEKHDNSDLIRSIRDQQPLEGCTISIEVGDTDPNISPLDFDFFADWNQFLKIAPNETEIGLRKDNSVLNFEDRALAINYALLEAEGLLTILDYSNIPYIVENRKTLLEKLQILAQTFLVLKSAADEVHKIINIASDITTLGVVQATINLAVTIAALILLVQRIIQLFKEIQESFFPPVLYHSGIRPKVFIEKAAQYMNYAGVEFGNYQPPGAIVDFGTIMERETWCPSKNDEYGIPVNTFNPISGAMKAGDFGYNLSQTIEVLRRKYTARVGIFNNVLHVRPEGDPFWTQNPASTFPDVAVEDSVSVQNGGSRYNYDEFRNSKTIRFATDDSDLWTLAPLANPNNPSSADEIISGTLVRPSSVTDQKRVIPQKGEIIDIPHALCSRKDVLDDLLDLFLGSNAALDFLKDEITDRITEFATQLGQAVPGLDSFILNAGGRSGAMKVENHFFSTPKCVYLEPTNIGFATVPRIPTDYADKIGAKTLVQHWHSYLSFVPGIRNANDFSDTNAKEIFENVRVKMNLEEINNIITNPYFSIPGGGVGKYTRLKWNIAGDFADADYWVETPWLQNVQQTNF